MMAQQIKGNSPAQQVESISSKTSEIHSLLEIFEGSIQELETRLAPVLKNYDAIEGAAGVFGQGLNTPTSPLYDTLDSIQSRINSLLNRVSVIQHDMHL